MRKAPKFYLAQGRPPPNKGKHIKKPLAKRQDEQVQSSDDASRSTVRSRNLPSSLNKDTLTQLVSSSSVYVFVMEICELEIFQILDSLNIGDNVKTVDESTASQKLDNNPNVSLVVCDSKTFDRVGSECKATKLHYGVLREISTMTTSLAWNGKSVRSLVLEAKTFSILRGDAESSTLDLISQHNGKIIPKFKDSSVTFLVTAVPHSPTNSKDTKQFINRILERNIQCFDAASLAMLNGVDGKVKLDQLSPSKRFSGIRIYVINKCIGQFVIDKLDEFYGLQQINKPETGCVVAMDPKAGIGENLAEVLSQFDLLYVSPEWFNLLVSQSKLKFLSGKYILSAPSHPPFYVGLNLENKVFSLHPSLPRDQWVTDRILLDGGLIVPLKDTNEKSTIICPPAIRENFSIKGFATTIACLQSYLRMEHGNACQLYHKPIVVTAQLEQLLKLRPIKILVGDVQIGEAIRHAIKLCNVQPVSNEPNEKTLCVVNDKRDIPALGVAVSVNIFWSTKPTVKQFQVYVHSPDSVFPRSEVQRATPDSQYPEAEQLSSDQSSEEPVELQALTTDMVARHYRTVPDSVVAFFSVKLREFLVNDFRATVTDCLSPATMAVGQFQFEFGSLDADQPLVTLLTKTLASSRKSDLILRITGKFSRFAKQHGVAIGYIRNSGQYLIFGLARGASKRIGTLSGRGNGEVRVFEFRLLSTILDCIQHCPTIQSSLYQTQIALLNNTKDSLVEQQFLANSASSSVRALFVDRKEYEKSAHEYTCHVRVTGEGCKLESIPGLTVGDPFTLNSENLSTHLARIDAHSLQNLIPLPFACKICGGGSGIARGVPVETGRCTICGKGEAIVLLLEHPKLEKPAEEVKPRLFPGYDLSEVFKRNGLDRECELFVTDGLCIWFERKSSQLMVTEIGPCAGVHYICSNRDCFIVTENWAQYCNCCAIFKKA